MFPGIPIIENIHQKVLEAVTCEGHTFDMSTWHGDDEEIKEGAHCGTTHCRAGWIIFLAGEQGRKLEIFSGTALAARQIYRESSPQIQVHMNMFFEFDNKKSMDDIIHCAEEEKKLVKE